MSNDSIDRSIIGLIQGDIPLESRPFESLAKELKMSEQEIVARLRTLQKNGIIRRWGAVLRHQKAGYVANAMVAWKVAPDRADEAGNIMARFSEVSHCYLREVPETFGYSLFAMVHAHSDEQLLELIIAISEKTGLSDYQVIRSLREFKKASMKYV